MAVNSHHFLPSQLSSFIPTCTFLAPKSSKALITCSAKPLSSHMDSRRKFLEFPHVSSPIRTLMIDLVSTVECRLDSQLLPCTLPPDVQYYENQSGNAQASLQIRSGHNSSSVILFLLFHFWSFQFIISLATYYIVNFSLGLIFISYFVNCHN